MKLRLPIFLEIDAKQSKRTLPRLQKPYDAYPYPRLEACKSSGKADFNLIPDQGHVPDANPYSSGYRWPQFYYHFGMILVQLAKEMS